MEKQNEIKSKNPFKVPENYFEEVNKKIFLSTKGSEPDKEKRGFIIQMRPVLAIAASVALFVLISYTAIKIFHPSGKNTDLSGITLQEFSELYLYDIDILILSEDADLPAISEEVPDISKEFIINYLLLENIDINEIYEFL